MIIHITVRNTVFAPPSHHTAHTHHTHTPHPHTTPHPHPHTTHTHRPHTHTHTHTLGMDESTMDESTLDLASRTPEKMSSLNKNATALRGRRGAVNRKQAETKDIKGHMFIKKFFRRPTYCSLCHEFLW